MIEPDQLSILSCTVAGAELVLHPFKAVWYPAEHVLIISDAHLGKADHFRKSGIAIPSSLEATNFDRLEELFKSFNPKRVIFLGDLFHSHLNATWKLFEEFISNCSNITFDLVMGNHDILPDAVYEKSILRLFQEIEVGPFLLTHHPIEDCKSSQYNIAGHLHPGVVMRGKAKQYLKLPCFYFKKKQGILPAFGAFTGLLKMNAEEADQIFVVSNTDVRQVK